MDRRADSASVSRGAAYRKRRRSYYAAVNDENSLDDVPEEEIYSRDDDNCGDGGGEAAAATRSLYCRQRECNTRKVSSSESGSWSIDSLVFKRELTRAYSGDTARSWSELEIPELLLAHPEILTRTTRCRCSVLAQLLATCRCAWCQHQRRKISSTSSSCFAREPTNAQDARRKDSGHSVSTCQSFLPPLLFCDGNSTGSLCHGCTVVDHVGDNARAIQRRHSIAAVNPIGQSRRRYSADQTHSPCGRKIDHADNRRLSEQLTLVDAIGNREGINGDGDASIAKSIIATARSRAHPRTTTTGLAAQAVASFRRESTMAPRADIKKPRSDDEITDARLTNGGRHTDTRTRRRSSVISPITPQMMRRRFSEQLILEGGLGSVGESENLTGRSEDEEAKEKEKEEQEDESLTAINARKRITLKRHYYPEGDWGYVIVVIAILVRLICHGLQLSSGLLMNPAMVQFQQTAGSSGTTGTRNVGRLLTFDSRVS